MELRISKEFEFSASHVLDGLPDGHKCGRLHGHSYRVQVTLIGETDEYGFVMDFGELKWVARLIGDTVDHTHLNDVLGFNPTAENIAIWLAGQIGQWLDTRPERSRIRSLEVGVSETRSTSATCTTVLPAPPLQAARASDAQFSAV